MSENHKTFTFSNSCSISIANTPSGYSTILLYIKDTPFFGIGCVRASTATEITSAELYFNDKKDLLLDEDIDPNSTLPLDTDVDSRLHKITFYKDLSTNQYRFDFVKIVKTGDPAVDALDPWKDFIDISENVVSRFQIEMVQQYAELNAQSRNEPDIIVMGDIPVNYPELDNGVGIMVFKRME
ncbi:hypothetical protein DAMA08_008250 [Martiniozyma asiatica (nom. inval.)]|nr:hypothetical protein DAMA08_008250 [Martiniozyma asiatica]